MLKPDFKTLYAIRIILVWAIISFVLLSFAKIYNFIFEDFAIYFFLTDLTTLINFFFQVFQFGFIYFLVLFITKKERIALYSFTIFQFIVLHLIFLFNLEYWGKELQFFVDYNSKAAQYLLSSINIANWIIPANAMVDGGFLISLNLINFYLLYVLSPVLNYLFVTWISVKLVSAGHLNKINNIIQYFKRNKIKVSILLLILMFFLIRQLRQEYDFLQFDEIYCEYDQIKTWKDAKEKFEIDVKLNQLKYFYFGIGYDSAFEETKEKYNLEVLFMGCLIEPSLKKYNYYIEKEILKEEHRFSKVDSILTYFMMALDHGDKDYLLAYSKDSIHCSKGLICNTDFIKTDELFEKYSMAVADLYYNSSYHHNWDADTSIYYFFKNDSLPDNGEPQNLRITFNKVEEKYFFSEITLLK